MSHVERFLSRLAAPCALTALLVGFVALGAIYSVVTPVFEAGDELWHYPHVQWIARGNGLPVQDPTQKQLWQQEGGQPPLYYATMAGLTFWVNTDDMPARLRVNPYARNGVPLAFGNKNLVVHSAAENFPWQGTTLAVHLIRLFSLLLSAGTVYLTYKLAQEIFRAGDADSGRSTLGFSVLPWLAAALVAFNPMFLFISASVNNDSAAALLATAALFVIVQLVTRGATNLRLLAVGIVCGLAVLTKVSNAAVVIVGLAVLLWLVWRGRDWRLLLRGGALILVPVLLLTGWWFARNYFLYGDLSGFNVWLKIAGGRPPQTLLGLLDEFQGFRISFWGNFGGVNLIAPDWVYTLLDLYTVLAFIGLVLGAVQWLRVRSQHQSTADPNLHFPPLLWILVLDVLVVFVALVRWTLLTYASQGRLMFPAIASIAILMTFGLYALGTFLARRITCARADKRPALLYGTLFAFTIPLLTFLFSLAAPLAIIAPAYAAPPRLTADASVPNPVHIQYDAESGHPELVGFDTVKALAPGAELPLTLYWRTDTPLSDDLAMYAHVYDAAGTLIGQWDALPGNGLAPTQDWQPGTILVDRYRIPLNPTTAYPPIGRVEVGLTRVNTTRPLTARNPDGQEITPIIATFKFSQPPAPPQTALVNLGDAGSDEFRLTALRLAAQRNGQDLTFDTKTPGGVVLQPGDVLNLSFELQPTHAPSADYALFAHLVDANGTIVAQKDAQPLANSYPTTMWDANERVRDSLSLTLPSELPTGNYTLEFGMYRASDVQRLPLHGPDLGIWRVLGDHLAAAPIYVSQ